LIKLTSNINNLFFPQIHYQWRQANSKTLGTMSLPSKKRSHSIGQSDLPNNEQISNDFYQSSFHNNGLFPMINPATISTSNYNSTTKTMNNILPRPKLLQYIEENIIGKDYIFQGPWGLRRSMFLDLFI
jgi:hypothetical protein